MLDQASADEYVSSSVSEEDESARQSRHLGGAEAGDSSDSDGADADEWEDVDDEWVTDSGDEHEAGRTQSVVADDDRQCDTTATNCPDILTGPQLIDLLQSLCLKANRRADVHTVGLVCIISTIELH